MQGSAWIPGSLARAQGLPATAEKLGRRVGEGLQATLLHPQAKPPSHQSSLHQDGGAGPEGPGLQERWDAHPLQELTSHLLWKAYLIPPRSLADSGFCV